MWLVKFVGFWNLLSKSQRTTVKSHIKYKILTSIYHGTTVIRDVGTHSTHSVQWLKIPLFVSPIVYCSRDCSYNVDYDCRLRRSNWCNQEIINATSHAIGGIWIHAILSCTFNAAKAKCIRTAHPQVKSSQVTYAIPTTFKLGMSGLVYEERNHCFFL